MSEQKRENANTEEMNERKHIIPRHDVLNNDALVDHLKAIGKAIIDDADRLTIDNHNLRLVHMDADIAPMEQVTTVRYTLERIADPRRENEQTKKENANTEEWQAISDFF